MAMKKGLGRGLDMLIPKEEKKEAVQEDKKEASKKDPEKKIRI